MAADLLSAVGEVVVRPRTEDLWKRHTTPRWGIRVEDVSTLPEGLIMKMQKGGEVEDSSNLSSTQTCRPGVDCVEASSTFSKAARAQRYGGQR